MKAELDTVESNPVSASGIGSGTRRDSGEDLDVIAPRETLDYGLIGLYAGALFLSAFLLMWVQPLFTKMVLPLLGGSSSVWNTAMMFFQIVLLAGYAYAHVLDRFATPRRQPWIHGVVLVGGLLFLPLAIEQSWTPPTDRSPIFWLIGLLAVSVGWPFFALSASAPLLQAWFARSRSRLANDPYFLYAASNFGSLLALLAFPFLLEPSLNQAAQSRLWMAAYVLLIVLVGICALPLRSAATINDSIRARPASTSEAIGWRRQLIWISLAFVPSSLLLGVTSYITTDLASAPLLWVLPLALYLLSFILAFSKYRLIELGRALNAQGIAIRILSILILSPLIFSLEAPPVLACLAHLVTFFLIALVCHTELANRRPDAAGVTQFYFCVSIGGAAGGIFNALIAPLIFSAIYEYYLALGAACGLRIFSEKKSPAPNARDLVTPAILAAIVALATYHWMDARLGSGLIVRFLFFVLVVKILFSCSERPVRFALALLAAIFAAVAVNGSVGVLHQERTFYGVLRVKLKDGGREVELFNGTTSHGAEFVDPERRREPRMYYARSGPVGQIFEAVGETRTVGIIGLGTGGLTCYRKPGQEWTFYEIDEAVERIARDPRYFRYLEDSGPDTKVILGDGRLSLKQSPNGYYDALIIDAFSSDSIPIHLLTRQALTLYLEKLSDHGILIFHISNTALNLAPVVANLVTSVDAVAKYESYYPTVAEANNGATPSEWVVIARHPHELEFLDRYPGWKPLTSAPNARPWTDDFSNIVSAIKW